MRRALVAALVLCPALLLPQMASARPKVASDVPWKVPATFGRMLPGLPSARWPDAAVNALSAAVMAPEETEPTPEGQVDDEENADIDAGYTYAGQLIDHDLTLDNRPNDLTTPVAPESILNSRTPAFDLDSVYGAGPAGSPQLYEADGMHLRLGAPLTGVPTDPGAVDLPRDAATGQAFVGDPRDDENRIVAGLHEIMLRFHNRWVDRLTRAHPSWPAAQVLAEAQRQVRWYYQWAVLTDFLPTVVGRPALAAVFGGDPRRPRLAFYHPCREAMPVEFSVAAYRFGHSMVRPIYRLNAAMPARLPVFSLSPAADDSAGSGHRRHLPHRLAVLLPPRPGPAGGRAAVVLPHRQLAGLPPEHPAVRRQRHRPAPARGAQPAARRAGRAAERPGRRAGDGHPAAAATIRSWSARRPMTRPTPSRSRRSRPTSPARTPLWTYVLAETTATAYPVRDGHITGRQVAPFRLGPVGGRIVAEVFAGLMQADRGSVLHNQDFRPDPALAPSGRFGFNDLIAATTSNAVARVPRATTPGGGSAGGGGGTGSTEPHRRAPHRSDASS